MPAGHAGGPPVHSSPLKQQHPDAGPGRLQGRASAGDAEANDNHVVAFGPVTQDRRGERRRQFRPRLIHVALSDRDAARETVKVGLDRLGRGVRQSPEELGGADRST